MHSKLCIPHWNHTKYCHNLLQQATKVIANDSDSDDDLPAARTRTPAKPHTPAPPSCPSRPIQLSDDSSDDDAAAPTKSRVGGVQRTTKPGAPKAPHRGVSC